MWAAGQRLEQFPTADFATLAGRADRGSLVVLDVRRRGEWQVSHIEGAVHIPLHELAGRMAELPDGEIWVHCEAGYRAAVAASFLAARGRQVVAINDQFSSAAESACRCPEAPGRRAARADRCRPRARSAARELAGTARHYAEQSRMGEPRWQYAA